MSLVRDDKAQLQLLRETIDRVCKSVPFYAEKLRAAGITCGADLKSTDDVRRLPYTTKSDLRDNYPLGLLAVDQKQVRRIHASSGTRGKPTIAAYDERDLATWSALCARSLETVGVKPGDVLQNCYGYGLFTGGLGLHQGAETLGATVVPSSSGRTQHQVMLMQDFGASILCCTPSYAMTLATYIEEKKVDRSTLKLKIGVFGAEPWSEECRAKIEEKLGIKAYDIYGLSEVMGPGVAIECKMQKGLHVWEDHFLAEIVHPETGEAARDGEIGELVLTTLTKQAMPLLRYRTGDTCALISEKCGCGLPHRRITRFQGRIDDMLIVRGVNVYPCEIESIIYANEFLGSEYQIVIDRQQTLDTLLVRVEIKTEHDEPGKRRTAQESIAELLKQRLALTASVEIVAPNVIPPSEGKALRVLDMRI
jgi:phenylacetate-CoA ligase